jgi:hypothetical protein
MAKLVARLLVTASSLGSNPDIRQKIINGRHKQKSGKHILSANTKNIKVNARVVDPDPDPYWIRIQLEAWIRIRILIRNTDPDPDPGGQK